MLNKKTGLITVTVLTVLLTTATYAAPSIHLKGNTFTPEEGYEDTNRLSTLGAEDEEEYMLLQFKKPVKKEYRQNLKQKGVSFKSYIPEHAYITKITGDKTEITSEEKVRSLTPYKPSYKIDPILSNSEGLVEIKVEFFRPSNKEIIKSYGELLGKFSSDAWIVRTSSDNISKISKEKEVKWITKKSPKPKTLNKESRKAIGADPVQKSPFNLKGEGLTAALWDQGWAGDHEDLNYTDSKLMIGDKGENCQYPYDAVDNCQVLGHGTHVAGTMLGGGKEDPDQKGIAPEASLVTYEWPSNNATELYEETEESISEFNSIISQNSWGYAIDSDNKELMGNYRGLASYYDSIVAGTTSNVSKSIPVVFSAGNNGEDFNPRYNTTTGPGGTAKNVITVGSVGDNLSMTHYSSWGPTDDGRIKPTIVANGGFCNDQDESEPSEITSTWPGDTYVNLCGTSMAAPAVSGTAILLNQQFNKTYDRLPEPATVKASLIHTAEDLGREGPDYKYGWGLVNATGAIEYIKNSKQSNLIKRGNILDTGNSDSYSFEVPENETVKFTLVWSDYPGASNTNEALVNDLDLVVRNEEGERRYPWTINWSDRDKEAEKNMVDRTNPVEQVEIKNTNSTEYSVTVEAYEINDGGSQDYTLLASSKNVLKSSDLEIDSPNNDTYTYTPDFNLSSNQELSEGSFSLNGGMNRSLEKKNTSYLFNETTQLDDGSYDTTFWANNTFDNWASKQVSFTKDSKSPSLQVDNPVGGENISGNFSLNATWSDETTEVEKHNYTIYNETYSETGGLNETVDSSRFEDGEYSIRFNVTDSAGNFNNSTISTTFDNTRPVLDSYTPENRDNFSSSFDVNASWGDVTSGVKSSTYELRNSSLQASGTLNSSIDTSNLADGDYNLSYIIEDYAGNVRNKTVQVTVDREIPSLEVLNPENNSFAGSDFWVNASLNDEHTGIKDSGYEVSNSSQQLTGEINESVNSSRLAEGDYNVTYTAEDFTGNTNSSRISISLDKTVPDLNISRPLDGEHVSGSFDVEASYSDGLSGVEKANYSLDNGSVLETGGLNSTVDSTVFSDGLYNVTVNATDKAGNTARKTNGIFIDNTAPVIDDSTVVDGGNISGLQDINISFDESSELDMSEFRWSNSTGNQTMWKGLNYTGFNTSNLSEGVYNLSIKANDSVGNLLETNITDVTIDNTDPEISLKEYNLTSTYRGWTNNSKTVEASCTDSRTGPEKVSVNDEVNSTIPGNLTVTETGNKTRTFTCQDYAGNSDSKTKRFAIDSQRPEISDVNPSNNSDNRDREFSLDIEFNDESKESGLNLSASSVSIDKGSKDVTWSNSSVKADISDLSYSDTLKTTGVLVDNLGHRESFNLEHDVKNEPEENSGGGGNGGSSIPSGFTSPDENKTENENKTEISEVRNDTDVVENDSDGEETVKLKPGKNNVSIKDKKSSVESIQTSSDTSTSVTVSRTDREYSPPENTEKVDEFNINVNNSDVKMNITFRVNKSRISEDKVDNTKLYRNNSSEWQELETEYLKETESSYKFRSRIPGFSPFIVAIKNDTETEPANQEENDRTDFTSDNNVENENTEPEQEEESSGLPNYIYILIAISLPAIAFIAVKAYRKRKISPDTETHKRQVKDDRF